MPQKPYNNSAKPTALSSQDGTAVLKMKSKKAIVFVDGSNWYHKLRKLLNAKVVSGAAEMKPPVDFDLRSFAENLIAPDTGTPQLDATEQKVYERRKFELESQIEECDAELEKLKQEGLLKTFSYEEFSNFLRNAHQYWEDAGGNEKHALARFLFSNITIGDGKVLELAYNPLIEQLFVSSGGADGQHFQRFVSLTANIGRFSQQLAALQESLVEVTAALAKPLALPRIVSLTF